MSIESTETVKRSDAINSIKYRLLDNLKEKSVTEEAIEFKSALSKLGIEEDKEENPLGHLTTKEFEALYNNVDKLSNTQLEDLMYKLRDSIFVNYSVVNDEYYK
jgi:hypothetical protein